MTEKQSKIGRKSRNKGKSFERKMAVLHRLWMPDTNWQTTRNSGRTDLPGDIFDMDRQTCVLSECKHRKTWNMRGLCMGNKSYLQNYGEVVETWGACKDKYPMLMVWAQNEFGLWLNIMSTDDDLNFCIDDLWERRATIYGRNGIIWHLIGEHVGTPEDFENVFYGQRQSDKSSQGRKTK